MAKKSTKTKIIETINILIKEYGLSYDKAVSVISLILGVEIKDSKDNKNKLK